MKNTTKTIFKSVKNIFLSIIGTFFLMILTCTAYFNTYYNAKEAFKSGNEAHMQIIRNYPDSLVVTPTQDIITKYDRAIEKARKSIETFPDKKKWHDDALFLMGKAYFYKKEMDKCVFRLKELEKKFPKSQYIPGVQILLGMAYIESDNLNKAEEVLLAAEKRFPHLNKDNQITLLFVSIAIRRKGKSHAIGLLEKTLESAKSDRVKLDISLQAAELYIELKQFQKAIHLLKKAPRRKEFPVKLYRIDRALFVCYKEVDSLELAMGHINKMLNNKNYTLYIDEMLYMKGMLLCIAGDYDGAIKVFKKLTKGVDSSSVFSDTSSYKMKGFLELANIYQKQKEDYSNAYKLLKIAASSRDTTVKKDAQKKVSAIEKLRKLRDAADTVNGKNQFFIGEIFRFELNEPDSACNEFIALCMDSTTDSQFIPQAMLQAAVIAKEDLSDTLLADSLLNSILHAYPGSEYAKSAQMQLGQKITIETREDKAQILYRDAENKFYKENKVKDAIKQFYDLSKTYSDLPIAPKSLFVAAWLTSTVLHKKKTAKMLYEKICDQYDSSIYCTDMVKPKLKVVIDTLAKLDRLRREGNKKSVKKKIPEKSKNLKENSNKETSTADTIDAESDFKQYLNDNNNSDTIESPDSIIVEE